MFYSKQTFCINIRLSPNSLDTHQADQKLRIIKPKDSILKND